MLRRPDLRRLTLACALLASIATPRAPAQTELADLQEDVRGLSQRLGDLSLRVEQLEHENAELKAKAAGLERGRDAVTPEELNGAVADLNAAIKSAVAASREEILQQVATQMENLAKQTNAALDSMGRPGAAVQARATAQAPAARPAFGAVSYTHLDVYKRQLQHLLAGALGLHALHKFPGHLEVDVGREEGRADFGEGRRHILLGQLAHAAEVAQRGGKFIGQRFKHAAQPDASTRLPMQP